MDEYITKEEFKKFLEELSVTIADLNVDHKLAWNHFNNHVFDMKTKEIKIPKN